MTLSPLRRQDRVNRALPLGGAGASAKTQSSTAADPAAPTGAHGAPSKRANVDRSRGAAQVSLRLAAPSVPTVAHFSVRPEERRAIEQSQLAGLNNIYIEAPLSKETAHLAKGAQVVTTFVHDKVDEAALAALPGVGVVAQRATGIDNIDLPAAKKRNIAVYNVPEYGTRTVAEFAFALLLAAARKVQNAYERTEAGDFRIEGLMGTDLYGKRLAIVGGGKIGLALADMARGFEMDVVVVDPFKDAEAAKRLGFRYAELKDAMKTADFISLHCPLNDHTKHIIDAEVLAEVKPGAILVNTARGPVVDTQALIDALESGRIASAALDTFEGEQKLIGTEGATASQPLIEELRKRDDVILTPHVAFSSKEALLRIMNTTAQNVDRGSWGGLENRVGGVPAGFGEDAAALREISRLVASWMGDRGLPLEAKRSLGAEMTAAFSAVEAGDRDAAKAARGRLADRLAALGADTTLVDQTRG